MNKILLDLNPLKSKVMIQRYLKLELGFEEYYGENLDALYDELTSITEDTCIGLFYGESEEDFVSTYIRKLILVFKDAEEVNEHLAVFFGDMEENYERE